MFPRLYISDNHFGHREVIRSRHRPFSSVAEMDGRMACELRQAEERGRVFHLGDLTPESPDRTCLRCGPLFRIPSRHVLVAGDHDSIAGNASTYASLFGRVEGTEETWQDNRILVQDEAGGRRYTLLLSHAPRRDLEGADFNLYGHLHDPWPGEVADRRRAGPGWLRSARHINVAAEMLDYRPRTLGELLEMRKQGSVPL